jgi:hypothetical protein
MRLFGLNLEGNDGLRGTVDPGRPLDGRGGRWSDVGDARPFIIEGRRPGCDIDRVRPGTTTTPDELELPGSDEWADDFAIGFELADVVDSAGDDERELGGAEGFVRR